MRVYIFEDDLRSSIVSRLEVIVDLFALETAGAKIDKLDSSFSPIPHDYIFRLDITVNHPFLMNKVQTIKNLECKYSDFIFFESTITVGDQKFIKIAIKKLKKHTLNIMEFYDVVSKYSEVLDSHNTTHVPFVFLSNLSQNRYLHEGLLDQFLTFFDNFESQILPRFVIKNLQNFTERSLIDGLYDFISIGYMIPYLVFVKLTTSIYSYSSSV